MNEIGREGTDQENEVDGEDDAASICLHDS